MHRFNAYLRLYQADPNSYRVHELTADLEAAKANDGKAIEEYRIAVAMKSSVPNLHYSLGHLLVGFAEIFPEFLSLWLFGRKILTDEMLINHLEHIPVLLPRKDAPFPELGGTVRPIFIGLKKDSEAWEYFSDSWHPMISKEHGANYANHNMDGIYYNGGSWMRIEICAYTAGKLHGWKKADQAIANRLWAELNIPYDFPASHEYLATDARHPFFGYHRVFAWNAFILQALKWQDCGNRRPIPIFVLLDHCGCTSTSRFPANSTGRCARRPDTVPSVFPVT